MIGLIQIVGALLIVLGGYDFLFVSKNDSEFDSKNSARKILVGAILILIAWGFQKIGVTF